MTSSGAGVILSKNNSEKADDDDEDKIVFQGKDESSDKELTDKELPDKMTGKMQPDLKGNKS